LSASPFGGYRRRWASPPHRAPAQPLPPELLLPEIPQARDPEHHRGDNLLYRWCRSVGSVTADGGQHLGGDPVLEDLRLRELRGEDEGVKTRLVDDG